MPIVHIANLELIHEQKQNCCDEKNKEEYFIHFDHDFNVNNQVLNITKWIRKKQYICIRDHIPYFKREWTEQRPYERESQCIRYQKSLIKPSNSLKIAGKIRMWREVALARCLWLPHSKYWGKCSFLIRKLVTRGDYPHADRFHVHRTFSNKDVRITYVLIKPRHLTLRADHKMQVRVCWMQNNPATQVDNAWTSSSEYYWGHRETRQPTEQKYTRRGDMGPIGDWVTH